MKASCASICDLPIHLQQHIFASAAAPLTTCKASAGITPEASLVAQWLLVQNQQPWQRAAAHQLWDVCELLLLSDYKPDVPELEFALLKSAAAGRAPLVHSLLHHGFSRFPRALSICLMKALELAAVNHHLSLCTSLVRHPCLDANCLDWAISGAASKGCIEEVQLLLSSRPDITITPAMWSHAMVRASGQGQVQMMQYLLQHGAGLGHDTQTWLRTSLEAACVRKQVDSAAWLLAQGLTDQEVGAVLRRTLPVTSAEVVNLLLTHRPGITSAHGAAAVYEALRFKRLEIAQVLLELIAPELMAMSWELLVANVPSEEALFRALQVRLERSAPAPEAMAPVLEAAIQHGHTQVARMLRFCGATCSVDDAAQACQ
jgi:hypothetical protein